MNESERQAEKGLAHAHHRLRMIEAVNISVSQSVLELFFNGSCWYWEREMWGSEREKERECWRWREKLQLIGIWVSSGKSSVIQQHLLLLALKLLWDLKAPGLSCSPGTASDPCLAYTANRNAYLHQPGQLKSLPLCPRSVSAERHL